MKSNGSRFKLLILSVLIALVSCSQDTEKANPNVLIILDTSGSMDDILDYSPRVSRMEALQNTLIKSFNTTKPLNVGLMSFSGGLPSGQSGGAVLHPVSTLQGKRISKITGLVKASHEDVVENESTQATALSSIALAFQPTDLNGDSPVRDDIDLVEVAGTNKRIGLYFSGLEVPQGARVISAHLELKPIPREGETGQNERSPILMQAERASHPKPYTGLAGDISQRSLIDTQVSWTDFEPLLQRGTIRSPNLKHLVQSVVSQNDWCGDLNLVLSGAGQQMFESYDSNPAFAPRLVVEFDVESARGGCIRETLDVSITSRHDDAVEFGANNNQVQLLQDTLEFQFGNWVGLRFAQLDLPQGMVIEKAHLSFHTKRTSDEAFSAAIYGLSGDDANAFSQKMGDLSLRSRSDAVLWNVSAKNARTIIETNDIAPMLNTILAQSSWQAGQPIVLLIQPLNEEADISIDSGDYIRHRVPELHVTYRSEFVPDLYEKTRELRDVVKSLVPYGSTPTAGTLFEAASYFRGEGVWFGREKGAPASARFPISHPESWVNGYLNLPEDCPSWNATVSNCRDLVISGDPQYISPIDHAHADTGNYIILISDGVPSEVGTETAGFISTLTSEHCASVDNGIECSKSLVRFLAEQDQRIDIPGHQVVKTSVIHLGAPNQYMPELAEAGGGEYRIVRTEIELKKALYSILENIREDNR